MTDNRKAGPPPKHPKRSPLDIDFMVHKDARHMDPPISREILGEANTVREEGTFGPTFHVIRTCRCVECGKGFESHQPEILCEQCMTELDLACSAALKAGASNGNLPPGMSRTVGETKKVSGTGWRPKVQGDIVGK